MGFAPTGKRPFTAHVVLPLSYEREELDRCDQTGVRRMIELLKIRTLVRLARLLIFIGRAADRLSVKCRRRAKRILDDVTAWADARDATRQEGRSDKGHAALTAMARSADMDNVASYPVIAASAIVSVAVISIWRTVISICAPSYA